MSTSQQFVDGLLDYCGIEHGGVSASEKMLISIDAETAVFVSLEGNLVHLSGVLDEAPESKTFYYQLLTENFKNATDTGYYRYAIDPDSRALIVSLTIRTDDLTQSRFIDYVGLFVERIEKWTAAIAGKEHDDATAGESEEQVLPESVNLLDRV